MLGEIDRQTIHSLIVVFSFVATCRLVFCIFGPVQEENFAEAAVCMLHVATIIGEYLRLTRPSVPFNLSVFRDICPGMNEVVVRDGSAVDSCVCVHFEYRMYYLCIIAHK